jgi:hypothetical protein
MLLSADGFQRPRFSLALFHRGSPLLLSQVRNIRVSSVRASVLLERVNSRGKWKDDAENGGMRWKVYYSTRLGSSREATIEGTQFRHFSDLTFLAFSLFTLLGDREISLETRLFLPLVHARSGPPEEAERLLTAVNVTDNS